MPAAHHPGLCGRQDDAAVVVEKTTELSFGENWLRHTVDDFVGLTAVGCQDMVMRGIGSATEPHQPHDVTGAVHIPHHTMRLVRVHAP